MPFDTAILGDDFMPMNHKTVQPLAASALKIFDATGKEIEGYHHITRGDTGATIRVAPDSYTLVQNDYAVALIEDALIKSRLDTTDARFAADYSSDGARMWAQWILPAHTSKVRQGVEASLRVIFINAYDGSTALHGRVGSFNWACANQAVSGKEYASFRFQHKGEIDLVPAIARLTIAAEQHAIEVTRWERWTGIKVTDKLALKLLATLPKASETTVDALVHAWVKAKDEDPVQGGDNLWCLANVLTNWATRGEGGRGADKGLRNWERQNHVAALMETKAWQEVEAVG
jgi:hypothetical protein